MLDNLIVDVEESEDCLICWSEPQIYGISTECTHFFCETCVKMHLHTVLNSGKFPGYCPICLANTPKGQTPQYGRISGKAMTFLEKHGVINKEFQFHFMQKQNEDDTLFFKCPAKNCDLFLIDIDPMFVLKSGKVTTRIERCPCGVGVCVECHQLVPEHMFETHVCKKLERFNKDKADKAAEKATEQYLKKVGKNCPNCNMFIIKNQGCPTMMCGDSAHGDMRKALQNGGCCQSFTWGNLNKISSTITNLKGVREHCDPPVKYKNEIAKYKKDHGLVMTVENTGVLVVP